MNEILLSGSVPVYQEGRSRAFADENPPDVDRHVAEAVRGIAAATFDAEARLVFGGHPSITPLVAQVAADLGLEGRERYRESKPIVVYQSRFFKKLWTREALLLERTPYVEFVATPEISEAPPRLRSEDPDLRGMEERMDPFVAELRKSEPAARAGSLYEMRRQMVSRPGLRAMFAIGGMEGVLEEAQLFLSAQRGPVITVPFAGGASAILQSRSFHSRVVPLASADATDTRLSGGFLSAASIPYPVLTDRAVRSAIRQTWPG